MTVHASNAATSSHNAAVFWLIVLAIFAIIVFGLVFAATRRRRTTAANLNELRSAVSNTLSLADTAVEQIEQAIAGVAPSQQVRASYDRALALRDQARQEMDRGGTQAELTQANQDAAQAVLALQGVMRELGMQEPLANPLDAPGRRCFYCGRDDRPPYTQQTISDGKGNSMEIWVCGVDQERLAQGRTPQVATVGYNGMQMPWWAVPNNPWYYSYGGPTWQYWLPFIIGMDVGGWFGGGWGNPGLYGGVGDWDDGGQALNAGDQGMAATPSDSGGVDFGGWGDGGSSGDSGGWDSGGWDSSGGGWDSGGGGDFGGDSGGGGWS